jgi:hypothetical protein
LLSAIRDEIGLTRLLEEGINTGAETKVARGHVDDSKPAEEIVN